MKALRWGVLLFVGILALTLGALALHPNTATQLAINFQNNMLRSFEDQGMQTQLESVEVTLLPLLIKWPLMKIKRSGPTSLPSSWTQIFQAVELSDCVLSVNPGWFELRVELHCQKIDLHYIPLQWRTVTSLNSTYASDFFFTRSDFRTLESKQGLWNTTIKADNLFLNREALGPLHLRYYFTSKAELKLEWPDSEEKMIWSKEPEQLRIIRPGVKKSYGFLNPGLHTEIISLLRNM